MPDSQLYTREAALAKATEIKTALAVSKLRFTKEGTVLTQFTTKAAMILVEADYDGYVAGGIALAAWTGPATDAQGGATLTSPLVNAAYGPAGAPAVTNSIGGWWVEDASGDVRVVGNFNPARPMLEVGDFITMAVQIVEARNPSAPAV